MSVVSEIDVTENFDKKAKKGIYNRRGKGYTEEVLYHTK